MYCLWLNGKLGTPVKVSSVAGIKENFDINALKSYYYGGSLLKWLRQHRGKNIAKFIENAKDDNIDRVLHNAFGMLYDQGEGKVCGIKKETHKKYKTLLTNEISALSKNRYNSFYPSSLYICASFLPSYLSSYYLSFNFSSAFFSYIFNLYNFSSYYYNFSSFQYSSFNISSFEPCDNRLDNNLHFDLSYISSCPLNMFGYGINLI